MKKVLFVIIVVLCLFAINSLLRSIYNLWQKQDFLTQAKIEVEEEKRENEELKKKLAVAESQEFIEEEARNKLFLVKPGENPVIIPQELLKPRVVPKKNTKAIPSWKQWIELFF